jgi:hypothetical protein
MITRTFLIYRMKYYKGRNKEYTKNYKFTYKIFIFLLHWSKKDLSYTHRVPDIYPICVVLMQKSGYISGIRYV